jgi:hypothetical protein
VAGAGFGLIALAIQSCADFGAHVPAVGVTAVVLCAMIARLGRSAGTTPAPRAESSSRVPSVNVDRLKPAGWRVAALAWPGSAAWRFPWPRMMTGWHVAALVWPGSVLLAAVLIGHGIRDARIEDRLAGVGLPLPGSLMATVGTMETMNWGLEEWRDALRDAVSRRPNWAEGHLRLGLVHLGLYRQNAKEWLDDSTIDRKEVGRRAEPLWLLGAFHDAGLSMAGPSGQTDLLRLEPIRTHLVPAVTCFLEARRCSPFLALSHAELAVLSYLLVDGDTASTYATRALALSGNDAQLNGFLAQVAVQCGDRKLAARCWRKELEANASTWPEVADEAVNVLSADELLKEVVTDGRTAVRIAERLYGGPGQRQERHEFFHFALARLAHDRELGEAERLFFEAHASVGLDLTEQARQRMDAALALEPSQSTWRLEYIDWLLRWGRDDEAHKQALIGQYFSPDSPTIRAAVDRSADALARGGREP